jgi:hypothetical protein
VNCTTVNRFIKLKPKNIKSKRIGIKISELVN